jgi:hypothetical protein
VVEDPLREAGKFSTSVVVTLAAGRDPADDGGAVAQAA